MIFKDESKSVLDGLVNWHYHGFIFKYEWDKMSEDILKRRISVTAQKTGLVHFLKNSYALRRSMLLHMIVSAILFIVILFFVFHTTVVQSNEKELNEAQASLTRAQMLNDTYLRSISDYLIQAMDSYEVQGTLYGTTFSEYLSIRSRSTYETLTDVSNLISNIELINYNTQTVLDGNGRYSFDTFGDSELLELLEKYTPSSRTRIYFYPRVMNTAPTRTKINHKSVISILFYLNKAGAMAVNLDAATYQKLVLSNYANQMTEYTLINEDGTVFASSDPEKFASAAQTESVLQQVGSSPDDQGTFSIENGKKLVRYIKNAGMGVTYLAVTQLEGIFPGSRNFWRILMLGILFLISTFVLSLILGWISSKPIRSLHKTVSGQIRDSAAPQDTNEFRFIETAYQTVVESNQSLREKAEIYRREREDQLFLNLMNPATPSLRPSAAEAAELDALLPGTDYRVLALMPDRKQIALETDAQMIRRKLAETVCMILSPLGTVRPVMPPSFQMLFILNSSGLRKAEETETMKRVLPACRNALGDKPVYMGIGSRVSSLDDLETSYTGAEEALAQAYTRRLDTMVYAESLSFPDMREQAYRFEMDGIIGKAVRHLDKAEAENAISSYIDEISHYTHSQFVRNLLHLSVTFYSLENSLQIASDDVSRGLDISTVLHWDAEDARSFFVRRANLDIAQLGDMKQQRSSDQELVEQVNAMIEENLYNPDFSINQVADQFSFSVNYLRSLYKNASGESLSGRITRRKLETACTLLDNTDETIESITTRLGFSTRNYFFTFFKKHMGMTPTQYRNREQP